MKSLHKHRPAASASAPSTSAVRNPAALPVPSEQGNGHGRIPPTPPTATVPARYDAGDRYGSGIRYVVGDPVSTSPSAPVAKVKMDLKRRTDEDLDFFVGNHIALITGNADFTDQQPLPADLLAAYTLYETKLVALQQIRELAKQATLEKDQAKTALIDLMVARGAYVQTASGGNAAKIVSVGLGVASTSRTPTGPLMPPTNLRSFLGEVPGVMELRWDGVDGARGYIVQCSPDVLPREFASIKNCSKTRLLLENLTVGDTLVFRFAAQGGSTGQSPWSAELIRTVG